VPFDFEDSVFKSDFGTVKCATGDSFVTSSDPWLTNHKVDLVDMELFAIAKVAHFYGVNWRSIKYASDLANEDASRDWNSSLEDCSRKINEIVEQALLG
jgi:adenosylhomocysteine nucleosidase